MTGLNLVEIRGREVRLNPKIIAEDYWPLSSHLQMKTLDLCRDVTGKKATYPHVFF